MSDPAFTFASPLTLLHEWNTRADRAPLAEVLVTGYTLDLEFLEKFFISTARALRARVTVVSDAHQAVHDAVGVRRAGLDYQHAFAATRKAFHPKLVLLVGDEDVWFAIGSGNPTMSGWGHNAELWVVVKARQDVGPSAAAALADWLRDLPAVVQVPTWIAQTLTEIADKIRPHHVEDSAPALTVVANLHQPLIDQLPDVRSRDVVVSAPFFDPGGVALRAVVNRFRPASVTVALQPARFAVAGEALLRAVQGVERSEFRTINDGRVHHGKLVEWSEAESRTALVGSANISRAALLKATADGGNCELGAIAPVSDSLLPPSGTVSTADVATYTASEADPDDGETVPVTLLGARALPNGASVEFVVHEPCTVTIEWASTGEPGDWKPARTLDCIEGPVAEPVEREPAMRAIRLTTGEYVSPVVFLTDTTRVQARTDESVGVGSSFDLSMLIRDPQIANRVMAALSELAEKIKTVKAVVGKSSPASGTSADGGDKYGTWLRSVNDQLGEGLATFSFPAIPLGPGAPTQSFLRFNEPPESPDAPDQPSAEPPPRVDPSQRIWLQGWVKRLVKKFINGETPLPHAGRVNIAVLYVQLLAADTWQADDDSWRPALVDVAFSLIPDADELDMLPTDAVARSDALLAVLTALLSKYATLTGSDSRDKTYQRVWMASYPRVAHADPLLVWDCVYLSMPDDLELVVDDIDLLGLIEFAEAWCDDPHRPVRTALEDNGIDAALHDGVWVADADSKGRPLAARIATLAGNRCAVLVNGTGGATILLREDRVLALTEPKRNFWTILQLPPGSAPNPYLMNLEGTPKSASRYPLRPTPAAVLEIAANLGVNVDLIMHVFATT